MPGTLPPAGAAPTAPDLGGQEIDIGALGRILYRRRRLAVAVFAITVLWGGARYLWERTFNPIYSGSFRILISEPISRNTPTSSTQIEGLARSGLSVRMGDLFEALKSPATLGPAAKRLGLDPGSIAGSLSIEQAPGTSGILNISLSWGNPRQGERILQELSKDYLQFSLRERQQQLSQGLAFLDRQAPALQRQVRALQMQLADFRIKHNFIDPTERAQILVNQSRSVQDVLSNLRLRELQLQAQEASVRAGQFSSLVTSPGSPSAAAGEAGAADGMAASPPVQADRPGATGPVRAGSATGSMRGGLPRIGTAAATPPPSASPGELVNTLTGVERDLKLAESAYTDNSPMVQELRLRQRVLKRYIQDQALEGIASARLSNALERQLNERRLADLQSQFSRNPDLIRKYEEIQQRLSVARNGLGSYIAARESFRLEAAQRTLPWEILNEPGFGYVPVAPDPKRIMFLSVLTGAVLGVMAALLRDRLDHVFHSPREVQAQLGLPLLGTVPNLPIESGHSLNETIDLMDQVERFALRESLRNLSTNFRMLRADRPVRLMTVTSTTQREGKTTIVALFGLTLSELGQRVLLVDADMRRPTLHRRLGMANEQGISNAFTDADLPLRSLIQPVTERLDLISAGPSVPDATKLLSSDRCASLVEEIRRLEGYDIVLFDCPPSLNFADPLLLSVHVDGLLFLVGIQRVDRTLPEQAIERIRDTGVDLLGLVTNQVIPPVGAGGFGYGYGYGYGYG
ncbi:MAG: GumC family protein, partial [Synechococcaceae cyanobacterium]